jgi:type III pantothenate kinase
MMHSVVVDVGNTRIKWGLATSDGLTAAASLPADDPAAWQNLLDCWQVNGTLRWIVTGVHPKRCGELVDWVRGQRHEVTILEDWRKLPLTIPLDHPDRVGIDRLLSAVAANRRRAAETPAIIVGAGTAVTVDWLDGTGAFRGGSIFPGLHLMARTLHEHTALLPLVDVPTAPPSVPGASTPAAIQAGVFWSVVGGIQALIAQFAGLNSRTPQVFLTGGDASLLMQAMRSAPLPEAPTPVIWPWMTLEGLRLTAEALP